MSNLGPIIKMKCLIIQIYIILEITMWLKKESVKGKLITFDHMRFIYDSKKFLANSFARFARSQLVELK